MDQQDNREWLQVNARVAIVFSTNLTTPRTQDAVVTFIGKRDVKVSSGGQEHRFPVSTLVKGSTTVSGRRRLAPLDDPEVLMAEAARAIFSLAYFAEQWKRKPADASYARDTQAAMAKAVDAWEKTR